MSDKLKDYIDDLKNNKICKHCFLESHIRAYIEVMADEPDQYVKMSTIYNNLKMMLDNDG